MKIISRENALARNLKYYFTGKRCKNGHISKRTTLRADCWECSLRRVRRYHERNPEKTKQYYKKNKDSILNKRKKFYIENKISVLRRNKLYQKENRDKILKNKRLWAKNNRNKRNFSVVQYRMNKIKATPAWANIEKIKEIYLNCPKGYHVDHILPLRGKKVCGLHVENNLQYLKAEENMKKGNKYENF